MRSLRWRIGAWVVLTFTLVLVAFTALGIRDDRERMLALERSSAESLVQHLAAMPEFSDRLSEASARLDPMRPVLAATGAEIDLLPRSAPERAGSTTLAVQPLSLAEGQYSLRYRVNPDRLAAWGRRAIVIHSLHGALALSLMLLGVAWILKRKLVEPVHAMSLQVRHMVRGAGWQPRMPATDAEVSELAAALRELGPAMEDQVSSWVEAERRAAVARSLASLRGRVLEHQRRALASLGDLEASGLVAPRGKARLRSAIADMERVWAEIRTEESLRFGRAPTRAPVTPPSHPDSP